MIPTLPSLPKLNLDSWTNLLTKVGVVGRDKRMSSAIASAPVFNQRPELDELYHGNDLARRIVDLPAREMVRKWIRVRQDDKTGSMTAVDFQKATMESMQTLHTIDKFQQLLTWGRLYGGAVMFMGVDDGRSVASPLDPKKAKSIKFLTIFDRFEIRVVKKYSDPLAAKYGEPELYELTTASTPEGQGRVGQRIHESRLLRYDATRTGRYRSKTLNDNWADSIFVGMFNVLRDYGSTWDSTAVLMQDFAQAIIKMEGLAELMAHGGEKVVMDRMELMDTSRSVLRSLLLDAEHEDYERKPTPLMGLPELIDRWMFRIAAAAQIPVTLLFGRSPAGMNATGESDVRFFYDFISAEQESHLRPLVERFLEVLYNVQDGPTAGVEPESWSFAFLPLWQLSDLEESSRRLNTAKADDIYLNQSVVNNVEVAASRFGGDAYSAETALMIDEQERLKLAEEAEPAPAKAEPAPAKAPPAPAKAPPAKAPPAAAAK